MTKNKNKVVRFFALLGVILFSAFLVFMPFFVNNRNNNVTYADSVSDYSSQFTSSPLMYYIGCYYSYVSNDTPNTSGRFADNKVLDFYFKLNFDGSSYVFIPYSRFTSNTFFSNQQFTISDNSGHFFWVYNGQIYTNNTLSGYFPIYIKVDSGFNNNIQYVIMDSHKWGDINNDIAEIRLYYYDSLGHRLFVAFYFNANNDSSPYSIPNRTYYFNNNLTTDNSFYQQGLSDGYADGFGSGDSIGYDRGYNVGYDVGLTAGYNQGLQAGSDVSFLNLIGATIDAPVQAFSGLFDFDVNMGGTSFNLKGFMLALLSVALVIAFIRIIMAK